MDLEKDCTFVHKKNLMKIITTLLLVVVAFNSKGQSDSAHINWLQNYTYNIENKLENTNYVLKETATLIRQAGLRQGYAFMCATFGGFFTYIGSTMIIAGTTGAPVVFAIAGTFYIVAIVNGFIARRLIYKKIPETLEEVK
jgi:hypothetical protein